VKDSGCLHEGPLNLAPCNLHRHFASRQPPIVQVLPYPSQSPVSLTISVTISATISVTIVLRSPYATSWFEIPNLHHLINSVISPGAPSSLSPTLLFPRPSLGTCLHLMRLSQAVRSMSSSACSSRPLMFCLLLRLPLPSLHPHSLPTIRVRPLAIDRRNLLRVIVLPPLLWCSIDSSAYCCVNPTAISAATISARLSCS